MNLRDKIKAIIRDHVVFAPEEYMGDDYEKLEEENAYELTDAILKEVGDKPKEMTIDQLMEAELVLWRWRLEQEYGKTALDAVSDAVSEGVNDAVISTKITLPRDFKRGEEIDFHIHMETP